MISNEGGSSVIRQVFRFKVDGRSSDGSEAFTAMVAAIATNVREAHDGVVNSLRYERNLLVDGCELLSIKPVKTAKSRHAGGRGRRG